MVGGNYPSNPTESEIFFFLGTYNKVVSTKQDKGTQELKIRG